MDNRHYCKKKLHRNQFLRKEDANMRRTVYDDVVVPEYDQEEVAELLRMTENTLI